MNGNQGTVLLKMAPNFIQGGIWMFLNKLSELLSLFRIEYGRPVPSWLWSKTPSLLAFPNPSANATNMIAEYFSELLPASYA